MVRYLGYLLFAVVVLLSVAAQADPPLPSRPTAVDSFQGPAIDERVGSPLDTTQLQQAAASYHSQRNRPLANSHHIGALSGLRVALSPGHGTRWVETNDSGGSVQEWQFQRGITQNLREDIHTAEWVIDFLMPMVERAGGEVILLRESSYLGSSALIDNDSTGDDYREDGTWAQGELTGFGGTYRAAEVDSTGNARASWSFRVAEDGNYPVYVHIVTGSNRSESAHYTLTHATGEADVYLSQNALRIEDWARASYPNIPPPSDTATVSSDLWEMLGTFPFRADVDYTVTLTNDSGEAGTFVIADAVYVGGGVGSVEGSTGATSGRPRWEESASTYLEWLGAPNWMKVGDVSMRPLYAMYAGADVYLALHTNCCGASGTSSWVWYPEMWVPTRSWPEGFADDNLPPGTLELAEAIQRQVVDRIQLGWDPDWRNNGIWGANFGELRAIRNGWYEDVNTHAIEPPLTIPAMLMEVAFHSEDYDSMFIRELGFRHDVARGYLAGLIATVIGAEAVLPPLPPNELAASATETGIVVSWSAQQDALQPTSVSDRFHVYTSVDGVLFGEEPFETEETSIILETSPCEALYVKVTALNGSGESLDSSVVGAQFPERGAARLLVVDGIDRHVQLERDPQINREYARIYGSVAAAIAPGTGFDMATDEAAGSAISGAEHDLVIWTTGETSSRHSSLSTADQNVIRTILDDGSSLIVSGAELGWDLIERATGDDVAFFQDVLGARYLSDDADSTSLDGSPYGLGNVAFGDCSAGAICVEWPDVLDAAPGGEVVLEYDTGTAAAVLSADEKVVLAGFPLESVADSDDRTALIAALSVLLLDDAAVEGDRCDQAWPDDPEPSDPPIEEPEAIADVPVVEDDSDLDQVSVEEVAETVGDRAEPVEAVSGGGSSGCGCRAIMSGERDYDIFSILVLGLIGLAVLRKRRTASD